MDNAIPEFGAVLTAVASLLISIFLLKTRATVAEVHRLERNVTRLRALLNECAAERTQYLQEVKILKRRLTELKNMLDKS